MSDHDLGAGRAVSGLGMRASGAYSWAMADYVIPEPEPKEIDETLSMELRHLASNAVLKGKPSGNEQCENCRYYLEPYNDISYCWHPKLRVLVGSEWWCQWWDAIPEDAP
jgi:hypothetical protein